MQQKYDRISLFDLTFQFFQLPAVKLIVPVVNAHKIDAVYYAGYKPDIAAESFFYFCKTLFPVSGIFLRFSHVLRKLMIPRNKKRIRFLHKYFCRFQIRVGNKIDQIART